MKIPKRPPSTQELIRKVGRDPRAMQAIVEVAMSVEFEDPYVHWDKLRYAERPKGLSLEQWWLSLKMRRGSTARRIPLRDVDDRLFLFTMPDLVLERQAEIDRELAGQIQIAEPVLSGQMRDRYLFRSLAEEAITSSQLEGAATTRVVAKEMIRSGRKPNDRSERMILNNFHAMEHIRDLRHEPLTKELLLDLHRRVTTDALDDPLWEGRFRTPTDNEIEVVDEYNNVYHAPPPAEQLPDRMAAMIDFANGREAKPYIHPVVRAIILHFWLAYDHPFMDGNGRTARALFYWCMLHHGYWLCEFISISEIIKKAPAKYGRAFLYTETDENDLTYFVLYHLDVIRRAVKELQKVVARKADEMRQTEAAMHSAAGFNYRQLALMSHALRHSAAAYTARSHRVSHNVSDQTARNDLYDLCRRGLLSERKRGRTTYYYPAKDLHRRLRVGGEPSRP